MRALWMCCLLAGVVGTAACSDQTDPEIVSDANRAIIDEQVPGNIQVSSNQGIVTLSGTVPDMQAKNRAAEVVDDVDGVDEVINDLTTRAGDQPIGGLNDPHRRDDSLRDPAPSAMRDDLNAPREQAGDAPADEGLDDTQQPADMRDINRPNEGMGDGELPTAR